MDEFLKFILMPVVLVYVACTVTAYKRVFKVMTQLDRLGIVVSATVVIAASLALTSSLHHALRSVLAFALAAVLVRNHIIVYNSMKESKDWALAYGVSALGLAAASVLTLIRA